MKRSFRPSRGCCYCIYFTKTSFIQYLLVLWILVGLLLHSALSRHVDDQNAKSKFSFPPAMLLKIRTSDNELLTLHLEQNLNFNKNIPGYSIDHGKFSPLGTNKELNVEAYLTRDLTASITVSCDWVDNQCYRYFAGDYTYKGSDYVIKPVVFKGSGSNSKPVHKHRVSKRSTFTESEGEDVDVTYTDLHRRQRRFSHSAKNCIRVIVVSDHQIYLRFIKIASQENSDFLDLYLRHIVQMFSGVDVRYRKISHPDVNLCVKLMAYFIAKTVQDSIWVDGFAKKSIVNARDVLNNYALSHRKLLEPHIAHVPYDHLTLLTGYDLKYKESTATLGFAYVSTMCGFWSLSVVEDRGDLMTTMWTVAHELGHSLSAEHDGLGNSCPNGNFNVMTTKMINLDMNVHGNHYIFSRCSINYFSSFIRAVKSNTECMKCSDKIGTDPWKKYRNSLLGGIYGPDDQCRMIYGPESFMIRDTGTNWIYFICHSMKCYQPHNHYKQHFAWDGTLCGDNMICLHGKCRKNPNDLYRKLDNKCPYGDQKGYIDRDRKITCKDITVPMCKDIRNSFHRTLNRICCDTCRRLINDIKKDVCVDKNIACYYKRKSCYYKETRDECCQTCRGSCVDSWMRGSCQNLLSFCHMPNVRWKCCRTCRKQTSCTDNPKMSCHKHFLNKCSQADFANECCNYCKLYFLNPHYKRKRQVERYFDLPHRSAKVKTKIQHLSRQKSRHRFTENQNQYKTVSLTIHLNNNPLIEPRGAI